MIKIVNYSPGAQSYQLTKLLSKYFRNVEGTKFGINGAKKRKIGTKLSTILRN